MAKIGVDVTSAVMQGGGIGRYTRELIRAVTQLDNTNQYHLFHAKTTKPNPIPPTPHIQHHPAPLSEAWLYRLWYRAKLPLPVQWVTGPLDLFHSPDFVLPPVAGNIPTLLTVHDLSFVHFPHAYTPALVTYLNQVVPWSVQRATHILADSEATKEDLVQFWHVSADKITVLYSGVGAEFEPVTEKKRLLAIREKYQLGSAPYLFTVGTIQPRKNYQLLIRAYSQIARDWPHNLVIAGGKGWLYDEILAEVKTHRLEDRVLFTGFADDADLPALYSGATLFLFPSLYEGFGLPIVEAMGCGVPVVSSHASCLPEVVGQAGVLLDPHSADLWQRTIHTLLLDTSRRVKMVADGARQARHFRWQKSAEHLLSIYNQLLTP